MKEKINYHLSNTFHYLTSYFLTPSYFFLGGLGADQASQGKEEGMALFIGCMFMGYFSFEIGNRLKEKALYHKNKSDLEIKINSSKAANF